jgi:hypothetical protein
MHRAAHHIPGSALLIAAFVAVVPFAQSRAQNPTQTQTLSGGNQLFFQHDIARAAEIYAAVDSSAEASPDDRAEAALRYALLQWRYFERPEAARVTLTKAVERGVKVADLLGERAELETADADFAAAREAALRSLLLAHTAEERAGAKLQWAKAVLREIEAGGPASRLEDAHSVLRQLVDEDPGELESARLLLQASLLTGDGPGALAAWRAYYWVPPGGRPFGAIEGAYDQLQEILPDWSGAGDVETTVRLIHALAGSRFFSAVTLLARAPGTESEVKARVGPLLAYCDYIKAITEIADDYYRQTAVGQTTPDDLKRPLLDLTLGRWHDLGLPGDPPATTAASLAPEGVSAMLDQTEPTVDRALGDRYGTYINLGETAGYFDLHMGHVVDDEKRTVDQYGDTAQVRFIVLDSMVSNGFESWAWDYHSQHGGWANQTAIYRVRPASANGPIRNWHRLTDPDARREWDEEIARQSAGDDARARADSCAYLPGLQGRLRREALSSLRDRLASQGLSGDTLRLAFIEELGRATTESAIFAHEGRHVIDQRLGITGGAELEYRAKLSEIAFAPIPRLALAGGILAPNIGDATPHGQANLRLMHGIVDWMNGHRGEINGLDPGRPMLPQLDRLSDDQLRSISRSLDPLAKSDELRTTR